MASKKMKFPKTMRIGAVKVTCKEVDGETCDAPGIKNGAYAAYSDWALLMEINEEMCHQQKAMSGVHEAMHCAFKQAGLTRDFNADQEEAIVRRMEPFVYSLIKDNPEFVKYVQLA